MCDCTFEDLLGRSAAFSDVWCEVCWEREFRRRCGRALCGGCMDSGVLYVVHILSRCGEVSFEGLNC